MTSNSSVGFLSLADGTFTGDHVQPSSVARDFLSSLCLPDCWKRLLQLAPDVSADIRIRHALAALRSAAHRRNPTLVDPVIAERPGKIIFKPNANSYGTRP